MKAVIKSAILRTLNGPAGYVKPSKMDIACVKAMINGSTEVPGVERDWHTSDLKVLALISVMSQELRHGLSRAISHEDFIYLGCQALCDSLGETIHRTIAIDIMLDELFRQLANIGWYSWPKAQP